MNTINILNGVTLASQDEITEHSENTTVHLTEEERTAWNTKVDPVQLDSKVDACKFTSHETNAEVHVTKQEREKWNTRTTKGVVAATQDGLDNHIENMTVHVTEEERTTWNTTAAIPEADNVFTGDNTHAGVETFNGAVALNGAVMVPDIVTHGNANFDLTNAAFFQHALISFLNNLIDGSTFFWQANISKIPTNVTFKRLENMDNMFYKTKLTSWDLDLPNVKTAYNTFSLAKIIRFCGKMPKLTYARTFLANCPIEVFESDDLRSLGTADAMFTYVRTLREFKADLPALKSGQEMCIDCKLDKISTLRILESIPSWNDGTTHRLDLGLDSALQEDADIAVAKTTAINKGWTITITYN